MLEVVCTTNVVTKTSQKYDDSSKSTSQFVWKRGTILYCSLENSTTCVKNTNVLGQGQYSRYLEVFALKKTTKYEHSA